MAGKHTNNNSGNKLYVYSGSDGETDNGDSYTEPSQFIEERWSPGSVGTLHRFSDLDSAQIAQHHTLGPSHNQSAPGDHIHDGVNSRNLGLWVAWSGASTSWTAQGTNPSLGTQGKCEGKYCKIGTRVDYRFTLVAGSDTTFGSGTWLFRLPFPAVLPPFNAMAPAVGSCHGFQGGTNNYTGIMALNDANNVFAVSHLTGNAWQSNVPVTWAANTSNLWGFQITYESVS